MKALPAIAWILAPMLFAGGAVAGDLSPVGISPAELKFFELKIRPTLVKHCYECHSKESKKIGGKLLLDTQEALIKGGESGSSLVAGKPEESLLIHALRWENNLEMPPKEPLTEPVIADFVKWIAMGAPDPRKGPEVPIAAPSVTATSHWSFQPVKNSAPPVPRDGGWELDPLDRFILAGLEEAGLTPTSDASPATLVRRLFIDLTGLAPSFEETFSFVEEYKKRGRGAVEQLVDDLLDSPRFGERWGRYWLDVARYGESNGNDGLSRNATFPHAWRYRDYVIDAFNKDIPFDRFITEQISGDLLPAENDMERDRHLVATGFLALGAKPAKAMNDNFDMDVVDDQIAVVGSGILGISVACARCHDHKHDPIPTRDYYALAGIFQSTETLWGFAAHEKLTAPPTELHVLVTSPRIFPPEGFVETVVPIESDTGQPRAIPESKLPPGTPLAMGVRDRKDVADGRINLKGESKKLGDQVPRGFLTACVMAGQTVVENKGASGRLELARWLTRDDHPLTARVMANRIWLHLFGQGIVGTPDDFGVYGDAPTHPELLDHLAIRFREEEEWSIKGLIRAIVLSRTYQLDSVAEDAVLAADPGNQLYARHLRRRLDAEAIRDRILQASCELDLKPKEGSIICHRDIMVNMAGNLHEPSRSRSIYLCYLRNSPPPELAPFDLPDGTGVVGKREVSALPAQALFLLNSSFVVEQSRLLARKLLLENPADDRSIVIAAIRRVLARDAVEGEIERAFSMVRAADAQLQETQPDATIRRERSWASYCQALITTNEFRYVD
jgi:Protein of unknown function (DUF1553)/Protein of unknown function (DUF1549)/Planctomycete cytochrome C